MACPPTGMERAGRAVLFKEVRSIIARAVCAWAGISHGVDGRRVCEYSEMSQSTGSIGPAELAGSSCAPGRSAGRAADPAAIRAGSLHVLDDAGHYLAAPRT